MSITFANAKNGCQGSGSSTSTPANTLSLFSSETKGYNFYKNKSASNGNWEIAVFGRAHNYSSSAETYDYTIYVFARKLNSATSHGDFKVTFYYRDKSYSVTNSRYIQSKTGKVRLLAYHTFDGLNCEPYTSTTIGAKVVGPSGTEASGTITATDTADFSGGASWSAYVQSDSSIKLEGTNLTTNRGFRHAWVWQWKRTSASSYTTDATTNCGADNTATSLSNTFSGLVRNTSYDVRARFYLRNYDPTDDTGNNPVPISSRTIVRTATTDKSDLSGSASLSGNRYVGGKLTVSVNNPDNANIEYQWCIDTNDSFTTNDGTQIVIDGETSSTYTVTSDHVGKYIYCKITLTKDNYNTKFIRKYTSDVVYKRTPAISVSISGNCVYGQTLTANVTCDSTGTKTYQWRARVSPQASPTDISGATKSTYKIGSGLVGKYIGCNVSIAETDTYAATSAVGFATSAVVKASNPAQFPASQNSSVTFSTNSQNKSFTGVTNAIGNVNYSISSQGTLGGVDVDYFSIPTSTNNSITIAAGTPAGMYNLYIECNISGNIDVEGQIGNTRCILTVHKASGSGSVTMNGWTYGGTVTNPTPSSSTNGTSNVSYTWYDSNKTQLSAKPTSTSNAGTYYVKATFAATTNYNEYTTDYVPFNIAKANPTYTAPTLILNPKYSGSAVNYVNAGSTSHGAIYYYGSTTDVTPTPTSVTSSRVPTGLPTTAGDAQTYYAWFRIVGDVNHNDVAITKIGTSTAVQPGTFTVTKIPYSGSYDGSAHEASIKVDLAGCTVKSGSSSGTYGTTDSSNTATNSEVALGAVSRTDTGESIVYYQVTKDYYKTVTDNTTITINRANTAIEPTVANNLIYNTSEQTGVYGGNYISLAGTRTAINAGSYTATATPDSNHAWSDGTYQTKSYNWSIGKYNLSNATIGGLKAQTYDGSAKTPTSTVTVPIPSGDTTTLTSGTHFTWSYSNNINAGTATATITAKDGTNYTGSKAANFIINKASLKVTADNKSKTVNDSDPAFTYSYSGNISGEIPKFSGSLTRDNGEAVGTYTIKIGTLSLQDNASFKANNYSISFTSGTLTINPPAVVAGTPTITVSQNYLDGDYGTNAATISYSISGGTGTLSSITIKSNNVTLLNSTASSGNVHKYNLSTTLDYSVTYKDTYGNTDTKTGSVNVTYPYNKGFNYTYAYKNASGVNQTGTSKTFTNDGQKATQYCLTASEWNEMLKFLYSAAYRKNGWSSTGLSAPTMISSNSHFTKDIYNSALVLLNKLVSTSYNNVVSKERITAEHLNRFRTAINKNR